MRTLVSLCVAESFGFLILLKLLILSLDIVLQ